MDPYHVLGLSPTTDLAEAEDAYHRLLRRHHPDLHQGAGQDVLAAAEDHTRLLNAAIRAIRHHQRTATVSAGARRGPFGRSGPVDAEPSWARASYPDDGLDTDDPGYWGTQDWATWSREQHLRGDGPVVVQCPACGIDLTTVAGFREHMATHHAGRLGARAPRVRGRRARNRLPLALLAPANGLVAIAVWAFAENQFHDPQFAVWAGLVSMGPSVIRVFSGEL